MICKSCGFENAEGNAFCTNCGASLAEPVVEAAPVVEAEAVAEAAPVVEAEAVVEAAPVVEAEAVADAVPAADGEADEVMVQDAPVEAEKPKNDLFGILSLVLGAVNIVCALGCCWCGWAWLLLFLLSAAGIALGIVSLITGKKKGAKPTMAVIGMILAVAAPVVYFAVIIGVAAFAAIMYELG